MALFTEFVLRAGSWAAEIRLSVPLSVIDMGFYLHLVLVVLKSTSHLKHKTVTQLIRDAITTIRNNNKRPDGQSVFGYINRTSAASKD